MSLLDNTGNFPPEEQLRVPVVETVQVQSSPASELPTTLPRTRQDKPTKRKWPDALATEVFIRNFRPKQDGLLFHPHENNVEKLKHPSEYEQLKGFDVTERMLVTERKYNIIPPSVAAMFNAKGQKNNTARIDEHDPMFDPSTKDGYPPTPQPQKSFVGSLISSVNSSLPASASITLWEKKAEQGKPHVIFFTGRSGHVADTGYAAESIKSYNRHASLDFLADLAKAGVGFTVVTLRGYGNNKGKAGEEGFRKDIMAFLDDWMKRPDRVPSDQVIVSGYSLGAANAAILASEMTKRGEPPAVLGLSNGFSSMVRRGKEFIDDFLQTTDDERLKGLVIPEDVVRKRMLDHPFDTKKRLSELKPLTHVCVGYSSKDEVTHPDHSRELIKTAREHGLPVFEQCFEGYGHLDVPTQQLAGILLKAYEHSQSAEGKERATDRLMWRTRDGVFMPQSFIKVVSKQADAGNSIFL